MHKFGFTSIETAVPNDEGVQRRSSIFGGKRSLADWIKIHFDRSVLVFQLFYFFFYAAFGSLFPLISIYFKQLGLSAVQCGVLSGIRYLADWLATPFWNALAEKWKKGKSFLIISLVCSMSFTLGLGFVRPSPEGCLVRLPYSIDYNESLDNVFGDPLAIVEPYRFSTYENLKSVDMTRDLALNIKNKIGQSPLYLDIKLLVDNPKLKPKGYGRAMEQKLYSKVPNFRNPTHYATGSLVMPLYSTVVYSQTKINQIFIVIILLVLFGELLSCPAIPLVDALVALKTSVQPTSLYGQQRMMGSVGWSLALFFIGLALDNSSVFQDYPCLQPGYRERNYMVCFATYSVFMAFALFTSTQFSFTYEGEQESMYFKLVKDKMAKTLLGRTTKNRSKLVNEEDPDEDDPNVTEHNTIDMSKSKQNKTIPTNEEILERQLGIKLGTDEKKVESKRPETTDSSVDSRQESFVATAHLKITKWAKAMRYFAKPQLLLFLFVTWFMGMGVGQVFTFLFWHMQELNGSPTLFGVATVINHISEIVMFFFSKQIIDKIGHLKVLYLGLLGNVIRFLYVSWITNPWWILPFEFLQGFTHAGVWVACCSYITQAFPMELRSTTQGFLQGVHYGLGRGLGACFGGLVISAYGSATMFRSYGAASAVVLIGFLLLNYFMPIPAAESDANPEGTIVGTDLDTSGAATYGQSTERDNKVQFGGYQVTEVTHDYYTKQLTQQQQQQ